MANKPTYITTTELRNIQKFVEKELKSLNKKVESLTKNFEKLKTPSKKASSKKTTDVSCLN